MQEPFRVDSHYDEYYLNRLTYPFIDKEEIAEIVNLLEIQAIDSCHVRN